MPNWYPNRISISLEEFTPHISGLVIKVCVHLAEWKRIRLAEAKNREALGKDLCSDDAGLWRS